MTSYIHFKFKSAKDFEEISFAGPFIKLVDLKRAVVEAKSLHKGMDFDLSVVDDHSKEEFTDDNTMVAKNTSVIVKRIPTMRGRPGLLSKIKALVPVAGQPKTTSISLQPAPAKQQLEGGSGQVLSSGSSAPASPSDPGTMTQEQEADAIAALNVQAGVHRQGFGNKVWTAGGGTKGNDGATAGTQRPSSGPPQLTVRKYSNPTTVSISKGAQGPYSGSGTGGSEPPHGYVCKRCYIPGHFIKECPTNGNTAFDTARRKRTLGVPVTMLKVVQNQAGGGLVDAQGRLVVMRSNKAAFTKLKDQKGGGGSRADTVEMLSLSAPPHLKCPLCEKLATDAVLVPCCQGSACDKCVRDALAVNALQCPLCQRGGVSPDLLMANKSLRAAVDHLILTSTMDSEMKAALEREEAEAREEQERLDDEQAKVEAMEADKKKNEVTKRADAKLDLGSGVAAAEAEADEFGGSVYAATALTTVITTPEKPAASSSESPNHVAESPPSSDTAVEGGGTGSGSGTQDVLQSEEAGDHHQQQQPCVDSVPALPTSEGGIGVGPIPDANHTGTGWSGLRKEKEVKESIGNDDLSGSDVDPKHGNEPSFQQHSMVPGPYPPGMRRMGAMGPRSVPPWVGRGMGQWGGPPPPWMIMRGPGVFMPPWGMGPGPMPPPRGGGSGVWHRGGRRGGGRGGGGSGSATRHSQQHSIGDTMIPSSGSAGSEEETTAATTNTTTEERRDTSSSKLSCRREEGVKKGDSSSKAVEENRNRVKQQTEVSSTSYQTAAWGVGTDENDNILQIGWGDDYVDSSADASRTGWDDIAELQMSTSTTHGSGDDNSTAQTEECGATSLSRKPTGLDEKKKYSRRKDVENGDSSSLPDEVGDVGWPKFKDPDTTDHQKAPNAADGNNTYRDNNLSTIRSHHVSQSRDHRSERKRHRDDKQRYGESAPFSSKGSSSDVKKSSQEKKKRNRSKDVEEQYSSSNRYSSSCVNDGGEWRPTSTQEEGGSRKRSRGRDSRTRRDHTVKQRESDFCSSRSSQSQSQRRPHDFPSGGSSSTQKSRICNLPYESHHHGISKKKEDSKENSSLKTSPHGGCSTSTRGEDKRNDNNGDPGDHRQQSQSKNNKDHSYIKYQQHRHDPRSRSDNTSSSAKSSGHHIDGGGSSSNNSRKGSSNHRHEYKEYHGRDGHHDSSQCSRSSTKRGSNGGSGRERDSKREPSSKSSSSSKRLHSSSGRVKGHK